MMQTYAIYLKPKSSFTTWPASDTLFGALCWAIHHLYSNAALQDMLDKFNEEPKFILSSAFPYLEKDGIRVRFFPKPLIRELRGNEIDRLAEESIGRDVEYESLRFKREVVSISERFKELKKVTYVSESLFQEIVEGTLNLKGIHQRLQPRGTKEKDIERIGNIILLFGEKEKVDAEAKLKTLIKQADIQKNQVDRVAGSTGEGLLFYRTETSVLGHFGGLWFLLKTDDLEFIKPLLRYLQDTGIGGKRSSGKGHFEITWSEKPFSLPEAKNPDSFIILSRWFPDQGQRDFSDGFASWNILNLRPKRETMYPVGRDRILKDFLRVFSEGSIFPLKEKKEYYGKLESAGNMGTYTARHNGIAIPVFAKTGSMQ